MGYVPGSSAGKGLCCEVVQNVAKSPIVGGCVAFGYDAKTRRFLLRFGRGSRVGGDETCSRLAQGSQFSGPHSLGVTQTGA